MFFGRFLDLKLESKAKGVVLGPSAEHLEHPQQRGSPRFRIKVRLKWFFRFRKGFQIKLQVFRRFHIKLQGSQIKASFSDINPEVVSGEGVRIEVPDRGFA